MSFIAGCKRDIFSENANFNRRAMRDGTGNRYCVQTDVFASSDTT